MDIPVEEEKPGALILDNVKGGISFNNVTFGYHGDNGDDGRKVIKSLSLDIRPGETLALVGPSGGGKTTLCNLIPRFYEIESGSISIDGNDIRDLTRYSLRRSIGIVSQDVFLFNGTVRDNIAYGDLDATDAMIEEAAKKANIHEYIMSLPKGYDTNVGERGIKLSGGQKQRISISRVFLKNPAILILDEATSALDNATEMMVQSSLEELSKGRTVIVVAHRLSTVRNADEIVVVDSDGIIERGTHDELLKKEDGAYKKLYSYQFR
jgi:ATP-binding cassette subfamily B protein